MAEFFASKDWQTFFDVLPSIPAETWDTFYSTVVSTLFALVIGLPLGVLLVTGEPGGVRPLPRWVMRLLNGVINLLRSVPFLILMIIVIPLSRLIVGTSIGTVASIVPLVIASFPFVSRLVETSIREVDSGVVEAAQSMGATPLQIITKVLIPESMPSLIANATIAATTILGYGAMAGVIGGGGLGDFIYSGISSNDNGLILMGAIPAAILAFVLGSLVDLVQRQVVPKGMRKGGDKV